MYFSFQEKHKKETMEDRITNHFRDEIEANDHTLVDHTMNYDVIINNHDEDDLGITRDLPITRDDVAMTSPINNDHTIIDIGDVIEDPDLDSTNHMSIPVMTGNRDNESGSGYGSLNESDPSIFSSHQDLKYIDSNSPGGGDDSSDSKYISDHRQRVDENVDFGLDSSNIKYHRLFDDDEGGGSSSRTTARGTKKRSSSLSR